MSACDGFSRSTTCKDLLSAEEGIARKCADIADDEDEEVLECGPMDLLFSIKRTVLIRRRKEELYLSWLFAQALPLFLQGIRTSQGNEPQFLGSEVQINGDEEGDEINWFSLPGAEFVHSGRVRFESALDGEATVLWIQLETTTPPGLNPRTFYHELEEQVDHDLLVLKQQYEEAGSNKSAPNAFGEDEWGEAA
ncbi:MAG TPA: hypothetical protein VM328_07830 [Fimbriimonadaceae bacterium]|nr:hypothetical protein [Fimbriimonadaceae bacterium]